MKIFVKAAHYFVLSGYSANSIIGGLLSGVELGPGFITAACELVLQENRKHGLVLVNEKVTKFVDSIMEYSGPCSKTSRTYIEAAETLERCIKHAAHTKTIRSSVALRVESKLTIGALKSLMKEEPWTPKENLMLVQCNGRALEEDSSTLDQCGVKDREKLLVCMGGSFPLTVCQANKGEEFVIPISSCFENVGYLKKKIHQMTGLPPEDQKLSYQETPFGNDETPLVALGIVRQCSSDMPKDSKMIKLKVMEKESV